MCAKKPYSSYSAARAALAGASFRFRAYACEECRGGVWHAANADKSTFQFEPDISGRSRIRRTNPSLAPIRSLEEVRAIAAKMRQR